MNELASWASYTLSAMGLTILLVWPQRGWSAWFRERVLRHFLPSQAQDVLDCYICCGFWTGLALSPAWWLFHHCLWCWCGCLTTPCLFWLLLNRETDRAA